MYVMLCNNAAIFIIALLFDQKLLLFSRDGASSVCSGASGGLSHEEMVEAIKINKEIEKTGMYFA